MSLFFSLSWKRWYRIRHRRKGRYTHLKRRQCPQAACRNIPLSLIPSPQQATRLKVRFESNMLSTDLKLEFGHEVFLCQLAADMRSGSITSASLNVFFCIYLDLLPVAPRHGKSTNTALGVNVHLSIHANVQLVQMQALSRLRSIPFLCHDHRRYFLFSCCCV